MKRAGWCQRESPPVSPRRWMLWGESAIQDAVATTQRAAKGALGSLRGSVIRLIQLFTINLPCFWLRIKKACMPPRGFSLAPWPHFCYTSLAIEWGGRIAACHYSNPHLKLRIWKVEILHAITRWGATPEGQGVEIWRLNGDQKHAKETKKAKRTGHR